MIHRFYCRHDRCRERQRSPRWRSSARLRDATPTGRLAHGDVCSLCSPQIPDQAEIADVELGAAAARGVGGGHPVA